MSALEVQEENITEDAEDVDIYSDVLSDQDSLVSKLKGKVDKLSKEKALLLKSVSSLQTSYNALLKECSDLKDKFKVLSFNSSALFKTAQAEIKRKDKLICDIRKEKDDLVFRKSTVNQALQRSRRYANPSPRKYRSPLKKPNVDSSKSKSPRPRKEQSDNLSKPSPTKVHSEEKVILNPAEEPSEKLISSKPAIETKEVLLDSRATNTSLEEEAHVECEQDDNTNKKTVDLLCDTNCPNQKPTESNKIKAKPPPLKGPVTAYSKRLYKRIHGVSPEKVDSKCIKKPMSPAKTEITQSEKTDRAPNCKSDSITSKLQKDVEKVIKLGTSSKTSLPLKTKLSPENQKQNKQNVSQIKAEATEQTPTRLLNETLVIQCDLRDSSKKNQANSFSLNETIDNILKKHKVGHYSPLENSINHKKEEELKKGCLENGPGTKATSRLLLTNKKNSEKLAISPVTFGKLVTHSAKPKSNVTPSCSKTVDKTPTENKSDSRKRKLSDKLSSGNENSPQLIQKPRLDSYPETFNKKNIITSLFGESPLKSGLIKDDCAHLGSSTNANELSPPSPTRTVLQPGSPIFPDSSSLDSDNNEDLVIDTTLGSQNTSPSKLSVSFKKDLDETDTSLLVKTNASNDKPETHLNSKDATTLEVVAANKKVLTESKNEIDPIIDEISINKEEETNILNQSLLTNKKVDESITERSPVNGENKIGLLATIETDSDIGHGRQIDGLNGLHLDNSHFPQKSCESQMLPPNDNEKEKLKSSNSEENSEIRFVPSPSELTLVSAFKHSENSVFAITEDTLGFVSALTRMRDISPIRTPIKKSNPSNGPLPQSQLTESNEPKSLMCNKNEVTEKNNFEFLKPLSQSFQVSKGSSQSFVVGEMSSKCANVSSKKPATSYNLKPLETQEKDEKNTDNISIDKSNKPESIKLHKGDNTNIDNSKISKATRDNPFKRTRPVRRITTETKVKSELKSKWNNENVQPLAIQNKREDFPSGQVISIRENIKQVEMTHSTKSGKDVINNSVRPGKKENDQVVDQQNNSKIAEKTAPLGQDKNSTCSSTNVVGVENVGSVCVNACIAKTQTSPSPNSTKRNATKTFKRSESLKMMQKPLPSNYINIMKNAYVMKSEEVPQLLQSKATKSEDCIVNGSDSWKKPDKAHNHDNTSEVDQISHIESINKKLRISKYQSKPDEKDSNELNTPETLIVSENKSDLLIDNKGKTPKGLVKNRSILSEKEKRNIFTKVHSTSLKVSHRSRRQNVRRSVSLGPEIRFRNHVNLPSNRKNEMKNSKNIEQASENRGSKNLLTSSSSSTEIGGKPLDKNPRLEKTSKEQVADNKSNILPSNNLKSEITRGPSPKKHSQKFDTKRKSPEKENISLNKTRRSSSHSPGCSERNQSRYKVSSRTSPAHERINRHHLKRSSSRSPEHKETKGSHKSSLRTYSRGRSRRSRYDDYHRRSPSPDHWRYRYDKKEHRSRSSHHKSRHRSGRSRSRSSEHRKIEERRRDKSRDYRRRSRSDSFHSQDRALKNISPSRPKSNATNSSINHSSTVDSISLSKNADKKSDKMSEENIGDVLCYKEKIEKLTKEIEMLKGKAKTNEEIMPGDSTTKTPKIEEKTLQETIYNTKSMESSANKSLESVKISISNKRDKIVSSTTIVPKELHSIIVTEECSSTTEMEEIVVSKSDSVKVIQNQFSVPSQENVKEYFKSKIQPSSDSVTTPKLVESLKVIQVKPKKLRKLGDSEVKVVSIK